MSRSGRVAQATVLALDGKKVTSPARPRAFTLLEAIVVVAIVGVGSAMAVPQLKGMVDHYQAIEAGRHALAQLSQGRSLAQRTNLPVEMVLGASSVQLRVGTLDAASAAAPDVARRTIAGYAPHTTLSLGAAQVVRVETLSGGTVTSTATPGSAAVLRFCPSGDGYFRASGGASICSAGNLAAATTRVVLRSRGQLFHVLVRAPLASADLRQGAI